MSQYYLAAVLLLIGSSSPVVMAGDLSSNPIRKPIEIGDKWSTMSGKHLMTFPAGIRTRKIDDIPFWPTQFLVTQVTVLDDPVESDHRPLLAVLELLPDERKKPEVLYSKPTLIAHRGASFDAPEHTLPAYKLALQQGADYVEPDLQMTRDGVLVCLHDTTLERTTDVARIFPERAIEANGKKTWPVSEFTLEEIRKLDAGSWKEAKFTGTRVPTFQEMIDLVKGKAGLIPETKAPEVYGRLGLNMERELMSVLKTNNLDLPGADSRTPVIIQSFSAESLKMLRKDHACRLPLVYLFGSGDWSVEKLKEVKQFADGIAPNKAVVLALPDLIKNAHDLGMTVTVWTFRSGQTGKFQSVKEEMAYFLHDLKVDALFTDNPDQFPRE